jgi:hypothetical protein
MGTNIEEKRAKLCGISFFLEIPQSFAHFNKRKAHEFQEK